MGPEAGGGERLAHAAAPTRTSAPARVNSSLRVIDIAFPSIRSRTARAEPCPQSSEAGILFQFRVRLNRRIWNGEEDAVRAVRLVVEPGLGGKDTEPNHVGAAMRFDGKLPAQLVQESAELDV